jgi:hypothetical protein
MHADLPQEFRSPGDEEVIGVLAAVAIVSHAVPRESIRGDAR